jgi:hypothetical protein
MNNRIKDDRRWDEWRVDFLCEEIYYTMTGLTTEEVDICQEALEQSEKGEAKMKYWIESSFNFEDPTKEYEEYWAVGVSRGEEKETETIASFTMRDGSLKEELDDLIKSINNEQ